MPSSSSFQIDAFRRLKTEDGSPIVNNFQVTSAGGPLPSNRRIVRRAKPEYANSFSNDL